MDFRGRSLPPRSNLRSHPLGEFLSVCGHHSCHHHAGPENHSAMEDRLASFHRGHYRNCRRPGNHGRMARNPLARKIELAIQSVSLMMSSEDCKLKELT